MAEGAVHVAVGIVSNARGEILITRRAKHVHQGDRWEFPGGKVESGEDIRTALRRELREELGIEVLAGRPLIRIPHGYPDKRVLLDVWRIEQFEGRPGGLEGQPLIWVAPDELRTYELPAADRPIVNALRLPSNYLITGEPADRPYVFLSRLKRALANGIKLVQLRAKRLPEDQLLFLYREARSLTARYGASLLLNGSPEQALHADADGIHLTARRLLELRERPLGADRWVGASCHTLDEVRHACRLGVDFVVAGPVQSTLSHPDAPVLGWQGLHQLTEVANVPVYALGGLSSNDREQAWAGGAQGIAAIRAFWQA